MYSKYNKPSIRNVFHLIVYRFPLIGTYSLPKPQGPYTVAANAPASIPFKNIFRETKSFELILDDSEVFSTTTSLNKIKQKQVTLLIILQISLLSFLIIFENENIYLSSK